MNDKKILVIRKNKGKFCTVYGDDANTNVTINGAALFMSLQLSSDNITISNEYAVPISDSKALSSDTYKTSVTITNNCSTSQSFNLLLVPNM